MLGQGEWEIAPEYQEFTIQEDSFYQMTPKQRQNFLKKFNSQNPKQKTSEYMPLQNGNSIKEKKISISPSESGIMYPPITVLNQIFDKAERYVYGKTKSITQSPFDNIFSLLVPSQTNPSTAHIVKYQTNGKFECDHACKRYTAYKICSHTVAAAEYRKELHSYISYFKKTEKRKLNDLIDTAKNPKADQKKTKSTQKRKGAQQNKPDKDVPLIFTFYQILKTAIIPLYHYRLTYLFKDLRILILSLQPSLLQFFNIARPIHQHVLDVEKI